MSWSQYLFSFSGRINRLRYWQFSLVSGVFILAMAAVAVPYMIIAHRDSMTIGEDLSPFGIITIAAVFALAAALVVSALSIYVKRLHDRNKSAWWLLPYLVVPTALQAVISPHKNAPPNAAMLALSLIAIGLSVWALVEIGLRGTNGPNRFGPDPLAGR